MPIGPGWLYGSDSLFAVLCAAFALDALVGWLPGFAILLNLPAIVSGIVAGWADRRLNRSKRSVRSRRVRGALVFFLLLPAAWFAGVHAAAFCRSIADGWIVTC